MNRTFQTAALLIALAVLFSFAQDGVVEMANKPIVYDTVHRVISDSVTISALENSQSFYESAFKDIQGSYSTFLTIIAILVTIFGVLASIYFFMAKKSNEKALEQLEEQQKALGKLKEEAEKESKVAKEKVLELENELKKQFDTSYRYLSRIYRKSAEGFLNNDKENSFQEYLYYMHIFYRCLIQIKTLNKYDLSRLERTRDLLLDNKSIKKTIKLENKDNICWYIVYLLRFIKRCSNDIKLSEEYFFLAKSIYKHLFTLNFSNFTSNDDI